MWIHRGADRTVGSSLDSNGEVTFSPSHQQCVIVLVTTITECLSHFTDMFVSLSGRMMHEAEYLLICLRAISFFSFSENGLLTSSANVCLLKNSISRNSIYKGEYRSESGIALSRI